MGGRADAGAASPGRALVIGFAVTGRAMTAALRAHGADVVVVDDHPSQAGRTAAESEAVNLVDAPSVAQLASLVAETEAVLPSPGVPDRHPVFALARAAGVPVLSEFDLAAAWDDRPVLAVTGTDGKTSVTTMVTDMMNASGRRALAVGNTDVPLVEAITRDDLDVFVVEASSFRLGHTRRFEPAVATWLNVAEDHLDVHESMEHYLRAKARIWADLGPGHGVAVANADDPQVMARRNPSARTVTFGLAGAPDGRPEIRADLVPDYRVEDGNLVAASGESLAAVDDLWRSLPHDLANALAASATALEGGATIEGVGRALRGFHGLAHRVEHVGTWADVAWYDDSKATAPHATLAAVRGFASVVLIAGGRNKGLDLGVLAQAAPHLRAVVAIGEAADEVAAAFYGLRPVVVATTMTEAVDRAAQLARPGDAVVLSPACASFDAYASYAARGDDFAARVRERHAADAGASGDRP